MTEADPDGIADEPRPARGDRSPVYGVGAAQTDLLATIGRRVGARLLDGVIVGLPLTILVFAVSDVDQAKSTVHTPLWAQLLAAAVAAVYEVVLIRLWGQTVGKRMLGIRVARITDGAVPDWTASAVRYLLPVLPLLLPIPGIFVLSMVIYLAAVVDPLRRGWHDRAAGTIVVKASSSAPTAPPGPPPGQGGGED
jgi:uncharacterized RDD family membrane protein YckC